MKNIPCLQLSNPRLTNDDNRKKLLPLIGKSQALILDNTQFPYLTNKNLKKMFSHLTQTQSLTLIYENLTPLESNLFNLAKANFKIFCDFFLQKMTKLTSLNIKTNCNLGAIEPKHFQYLLLQLINIKKLQSVCFHFENIELEIVDMLIAFIEKANLSYLKIVFDGGGVKTTLDNGNKYESLLDACRHSNISEIEFNALPFNKTPQNAPVA